MDWLKRHWLAALLVTFILGAAAWALLYDLIRSVDILTDVIRIDFDDLVGLDLVGVGAVIAGVAALVRAAKNGYVEKKHYDQLEERVRLLEEDRHDGLDEIE